MTSPQPQDPPPHHAYGLNDAYRQAYPAPALRPVPPGSATGAPASRSGRRTGLVIGGGLLALVLFCCGGLALIGDADDPGKPKPAASGKAAVDGDDVAAAAPITVPSTAPADAAPPATPSGTPTASPTPAVQTRTVTETAKLPFATRTVQDSSLAKGKRVVRTRGVTGVRTLTYEVTLTDGVPTGKRLIRSAVTRKPVTQVTAVGTKTKPKPTSRCDPNYGGCVPIASDVDCAGGSGNGPAYVTGPVRVIGSDIYDLDRDGDGVGCDD